MIYFRNLNIIQKVPYHIPINSEILDLQIEYKKLGEATSKLSEKEVKLEEKVKAK